MKQPLRACGVALCLYGLVACSQTPAQTADNQYDGAQTSASSTDPVTTTTSTELTPTSEAPNASSKGALATTSDNRSAATGTQPSAASPAPASAPAAVDPPSPPAGTAPDNTKVNKRDTDSAALTPLDQGNNESDLKITQQIRQAVMADSTLSFTAKNVKIITAKGKVTLRGPVNSAAERTAIETAARKVAGAQVDNQIEVKK